MSEMISSELNRALTLTCEYSSPYNALIRDEIVMGISRYFLERWVPVLGTGAAAVVNTLRQLDYRCHGEAIVISGENLATEAAISRRHLYTCLDTPWINAFVRTESGHRIRTNDGKINQEINRYFVRMDDPLTPADASQLLNVLANLSDNPLDAAQRALALRPGELWAITPKRPSEHFIEPRPITAYDVLKRAFPTWQASDDEQQQQFAQLAESLHRHITLVRQDGKTSKIIVPQYFRKRWWKKLGHDLAWAYLWLRSYVYDNPEEGIRRDVCWVPSLNNILDIIDRPREWWRRHVEATGTTTGEWSADDFFKQIDMQKGRDPQHPQWVARKYLVALDIPIAPEDRSQYEILIKNWQGDSVSHGSATSKHTGQESVSHITTHQQAEALPHLNTLESRGSAIFEHTGQKGVCHTPTQGSAIPVHSESKQEKKASIQMPELKNNSKQPNEQPNKPAAAENIYSLFEQIANTLEKTPKTPFFQAANVQAWLEQTWPEPIRPHTPAWTSVMSNQVSQRDLVALILSVWADASIKHPPRYLSWLIQRWQTLPDAPPVDQWNRWQKLADMPITDWAKEGRAEWLELASAGNRALPFGLDQIEAEIAETAPEGDHPSTVISSQTLSSDAPPTDVLLPTVSDGLDEYPGDSFLTMRDIWMATLGQLSLQLNRSTYTEWVEGTKAVSYSDGVLTVRARHGVARDLLAQRFNHSIELSVSRLAQMPIVIRYIADTPSAISSNSGSSRHSS